MLKENEHIEYIGNKLGLIVSREHTFGTDALLLADFAAPKKNERVCDFGTGCGIIPFCWLRDGIGWVTAVEISENAAEMLNRSRDMNALDERLNVINADLRELKGILPNGSLELITMNPPYTPLGKGIESSTQAALHARHECSCTINDVCTAASKYLKFGGRLCICLRPERLADAFAAMRAAGIEPKRLRFVAQREKLPPWLFLLEGKLGRKPGMTVEALLTVENSNGSLSDEMKRIIGEYANMGEC